MTFTLNALVAMAWRTVKNPREGAAEVLSLGIPREALWPGLVLVVVLSVIFAQITVLVMTGTGGESQMPMAIGILGVVQFLLLVVMSFAIFGIGRAMGGRGSLEESILLVVWLQFVMICLQVLQTALLLVMPGLAGIVTVAGLLLFLWLLTNFIAVLHGFNSLFMVFLMILMSAFGIAFALTLVLSILGVVVPGGGSA